MLIRVEQLSTPLLVKGIKQGKIDVAFAGTMGEDPEVRFDPCWSQEAVLVVNRLHPLANRDEVSLKDLSDQYLISYNLTGPLGAELTELVKDYELTIDCLYSDETTLASMVVGNPDMMAIACRSWLLDSFERDIKLVKISEAPRNFHQMYLCSNARVEQSKTVSEFIDTALDYCSNLA